MIQAILWNLHHILIFLIHHGTISKLSITTYICIKIDQIVKIGRHVLWSPFRRHISVCIITLTYVCMLFVFFFWPHITLCGISTTIGCRSLKSWHKYNIDDGFFFSFPVWVVYKRETTLISGIFPRLLCQCRGHSVSADYILNVGIRFYFWISQHVHHITP